MAVLPACGNTAPAEGTKEETTLNPNIMQKEDPSKDYQLERVNTGDAWHIVRQGGYDNMCARIGINNDLGDYSHDGDIGGGQY